MTLLEILNNVLTQSSFLEKASFTNNADVDDKQMVSIANRVAYEIMNYYDWGGLRQIGVISLVEGSTQYQLPDDYQSYVPDSAWETDGSRKVDVPVDDATWYQYKFSSLTSGGTIRARFYGDFVQVIEPFDGGSFSYEYVTKYPIRGSEGAAKELFTKDSDTFILDDQLLILGIQAHWQQAKLMPSYMEHMANYMTKMTEAIGRSNAGQTIGGTPAMTRRDPYTKLWVR